MRPGRHQRRNAITYLEVQVAMAMLALGVSGLYATSVVQSRHSARLVAMMDDSDPLAVNPNASTWAQKLGVYADIEDAVASRPPVAPRVQNNIIFDNLSATGATASDIYSGSEWDVVSFSPSYGGRFHRSPFYYPGTWFEFEFAGLPPGRYDVLTTYPPWPASGTAVPHDVIDGSTLLETVTVNQTLPQTDLNYDGQPWHRIGVFVIESGVLKVKIRNDDIAGYYIRADAVLVREAATMQVVSVNPNAQGGFTAVLEDQP